jgi:two-component system sensor histidine kinase AgrC
LTSLFCNLLDNALESADNIPDSFIELTVEKKENSPFIIIILINSCRSTPVYDQDGLPVSHKANKGRHGFGIKSIKKSSDGGRSAWAKAGVLDNTRPF